MTTQTDVLIIGSGPTGLMLANVLVRNGVRVILLDRKAGPTQESRAVVIHAKTLELFDKLGLAESMIEEGESLDSFRIYRKGKDSGKIRFRSDKGVRRTPYPFALIYGQDHTEHTLLQQLAEAGCHVRWNTEMLSLEQHVDGVRVQVRAADGQETIEVAWVVGADGSHSAVRRALALNFQGRSYRQSLFIADIDVEGELQAHRGMMDLERDGFFLFVPMRDDKRFRLFGTLPPEMAEREQITLDDVRQILADHSGLRLTIPLARWTSVYRTHLRIAEHFRLGRVFLAGDAAHVHSPAGGQGMNTGIGDAFNLGWKLALVVKGQARESLLDSYEAERVPFAHAILNESDVAFQFMTAKRESMRWLKMRVTPVLFSAVSALPFIQRRAFWLLSQLWTAYRGSPAVKDAFARREGPRAGDRAPYGFFESGSDAGKSTFDLLHDQRHQLLLFTGVGKRALKDSDILVERLQALLEQYSAPIDLHVVSAQNSLLHTLYSAGMPTVFLLRPDGQIAYRGGGEDVDGLSSYLAGVFTEHMQVASSTEIAREPLYH